MSAAKKMTFGIMLALVLWGIYLAIGATGVFVQNSLMDARKSGIVIFFVALFLGLWGIVLKGSPRKQTESSEADRTEVAAATSVRRPWNAAGLLTVILAGLGIACWISAIYVSKSAALTATTILGWSAALLMIGSATAGIVALSDRSMRRGKWLGFVGLIASICSLVCFWARMSS